MDCPIQGVLEPEAGEQHLLGQPSVLRRSGTDRLRNVGLSEAQIQHMAESPQLPETVNIVAPTDGFILTRNITAGRHFLHRVLSHR